MQEPGLDGTSVPVGKRCLFSHPEALPPGGRVGERPPQSSICRRCSVSNASPLPLPPSPRHLCSGRSLPESSSILSDQSRGGATVRAQRESADILGSRTVLTVEVILILMGMCLPDTPSTSAPFSYRGVRLGGEYDTTATLQVEKPRPRKGRLEFGAGSFSSNFKSTSACSLDLLV